MEKKHKQILLFSLLLILIILISIYFKEYLTLETIKQNKEIMQTFVANHFILSSIIFFTIVLITVNSPIPLAAPSKILGGLIFGLSIGFLYNVIATTAGCFLGYLAARYLLHNNIQNKYKEQLKKINKEINEHGIYYIITLRIILVVPYFLINIFMGILKIKPKNYLLGTLIGVMLPSLIYANLGSKLESIQSTSDIFSFDLILSLIFVALLILSPRIYSFIKHKSSKRNIA